VQAVCMTQSPSSLIRPVSSATGNEFRRRDHAAFGMTPAQQRLAARHLAAREIEHG
jgi:hypothetical protein